MHDNIVDVRKLRISAPDLQTQFESLLDCVWRTERFEKEMDRIEANARVIEAKEKRKNA